MITEAGYDVQAESFTNMSKAARMAADAEEALTELGSLIAAFEGWLVSVSMLRLVACFARVDISAAVLVDR